MVQLMEGGRLPTERLAGLVTLVTDLVLYLKLLIKKKYRESYENRS
jgi:hypothetical protein